MLLKLADRNEANADELALLEAANVGKPHWLARSAEIKGNTLQLLNSANTPVWDKH